MAISPRQDGLTKNGREVSMTEDTEINRAASTDGSSREAKTSDSQVHNGSDSRGGKTAYPSSVWEALINEEVCVCDLFIFLGLALIDSCTHAFCNSFCSFLPQFSPRIEPPSPNRNRGLKNSLFLSIPLQSLFRSCRFPHIKISFLAILQDDEDDVTWDRFQKPKEAQVGAGSGKQIMPTHEEFNKRSKSSTSMKEGSGKEGGGRRL